MPRTPTQSQPPQPALHLTSLAGRGTLLQAGLYSPAATTHCNTAVWRLPPCARWLQVLLSSLRNRHQGSTQPTMHAKAAPPAQHHLLLAHAQPHLPRRPHPACSITWHPCSYHRRRPTTRLHGICASWHIHKRRCSNRHTHRPSYSCRCRRQSPHTAGTAKMLLQQLSTMPTAARSHPPPHCTMLRRRQTRMPRPPCHMPAAARPPCSCY